MNPPRFFLPGWALGRGPLNAAVEALAGRFIDLPGYRETPLIADFDAAVADIASRLPAGATLAGWSIGAQLALAVAARHPDKVGKLLLVAGTTSFVQRDGWPHAMAPATLAEFAAAIRADAAGMLPRFVGGFNRGDALAKEVTRQILDLADPLPAADVLDAGLNWLRDVDLRPDATQVRAPTLLLHGDTDPLMPAAAAQMLAALIPGAQLELLPACAHAPFLSRPDDFLAAARRFLND
ncbi:alpha/beta fold hydrolase [Azonexus hydrophilus]|uniref:alpha/beta fold hydrolase n=1 Tax=Azonexus hydrophilus TaxID=418702 RepID=UPI002492E841|nr:alpha/beta fold hydrolase [Azonexus hydrophilus]